MNLEIDFLEAINGSTKTLTFSRTDVCGTCKGTKSKPGTSPSSCGGCGGTGFQTIRQGPFTIQQVCGNCDGSGQVIRNPCMTCRGKGSVFNTVKETITIPKGVDNGVNLRVSKKGHFSPVGPSGDLMVQIKVKPHPYFKRDGSDILTDQYITVS
jgi:molecular chaperone DnaJ